MRYIIAAAVGAVMSAGAAQAAVYQYDLTMGLERLTLHDASFVVEGEIPAWLSGASCSTDGISYCETDRLDVTNDRHGFSFYGLFPSTLTGTLLLDAEFTGSVGTRPACEGDYLLCYENAKASSFRYSATAGGFYLRSASENHDKILSTGGLRWLDGGAYSDAAGGVTLQGHNYISADYTTTNLSITEIAPVPLPASLPLLGIGLAAVGWVARRRRS